MSITHENGFATQEVEAIKNGFSTKEVEAIAQKTLKSKSKSEKLKILLGLTNLIHHLNTEDINPCGQETIDFLGEIYKEAEKQL